MSDTKESVKSSKPVKDVKPPIKIFTNPAFKAMGIPAIKLPSRNWMIFWLTVTAAVGGFGYDKYQQKQIIKKYTDRVKPLSEKTMNITTIPRKITVFIAPPPSDYLETSLKVWRRYIKPVLYYAGLDYDVVQEERQGVIRTEVANRIRNLRKKALESNDVEPIPNAPVKSDHELTKLEEIELGKEYKKKFDWRDAIGIFYKHDKPKEIISEDSQVSNPLFSGGVICLGRGAYKEYINGIHEGLLGPLDPPAIEVVENVDKIENKITEEKTDDISIEEKNIDVTETQVQENTESNTEQKEEHTDVYTPYILPTDYESCQFPPTELKYSGNAIIDPETNIPILLHQPLLVIPVPNLIGFLTVPQRIYRFYRKRYLTEEICSEVIKLVEQKDIRPFENPNDLKLAVTEEDDWPSAWVKKGLERKSEWTRGLHTDPRIASLMHVCNDSITDAPADQVIDNEE